MPSGSFTLPSNRAFGCLFVVVFALLAAWQWIAHGPRLVFYLCVGVAGLLALITVVAPRLLAPLNAWWMRLGQLLNRIVSPVVLGVLYYGLVVPIGLLMRGLGRDELRLNWRTQEESYWLRRQESTLSPESFHRQF